jgi:hypothetical protein
MPSAHHNNPELMKYADDFLKEDLSAKRRYAYREPRLFYVWGHSYEFDRDNNWELIEEFCQKLANNDEIWYATNIEIYDYTQAYKSLRYSADGHIIYNPTLYTIWLDVDGVPYRIEPGETLRLKT